ncbi:MAG TPA: hypothetical protein VK395_12730 [Gemmataceae bacterium]|nr:hypothetical protein [Gemmataceae bacterium]
MNYIAFIKWQGSPAYLRFIVKDSLGQVWDGMRMNPDHTSAQTFADVIEASRIAQDVQRRHCEHYPYHEFFEVPVRIELFSDGDVRPDELKAWLLKASCMTVGFGCFGSGPKTSTVLMIVDYSRFHEVVQRTVDGRS